MALLHPGLALGQQAPRLLRVAGYVESQIGWSRTPAGSNALVYGRLRTDLDLRVSGAVRASAAGVLQLYVGDTSIPVRDLLPNELDSLVDTATVTFENQLFLNHFYAAFRLDPIEVTAGKQYLAWGVAYAFNPTELFRPKDLLQPTYDREGVTALSVSAALGSLSDVQVVGAIDDSIESGAVAVRGRHHIAGFDISALGAILREPGAPGVGTAPPEGLEPRYVIGGDMTGEILGLGVWAEGTWSSHLDERWIELTIGGNYTLGDGTLLSLEAFVNGRGQWGAPYPPELWLDRISGRMVSLGSVVAYAVASRPMGQLWTVGLSTIVNPGDRSAAFIPSVAYAASENVDLLFNAALYAGGNGTEYGTGAPGAFVRGRFYF